MRGKKDVGSIEKHPEGAKRQAVGDGKFSFGDSALEREGWRKDSEDWKKAGVQGSNGTIKATDGRAG